MSVRRLADEAVQPASFAFSRANAAEARKWIRKYPKGREHSAVIPLLMLAQDQEGWVSRAAIEHVAQMLDMPLIRVLEVATFYTQFQLQPVGTRAHLQVCGTTPCMLRGAGDLIEMCRQRIHAEPFHTNEAGTLSWEEVECLGACVNAPVVMIFKDTYEDLTPERLGEIIDAFEAGRGAEIRPGPQVDRIASAPASGLTTLRDDGETATAASVPGPAGLVSAETGMVAAPVAQVQPSGIARPERPDDLKLISGVGPRLEEKLHALGIYRFEQIAAWTAEEIAWVDSHLNFRGRILRDDWKRQAEALARGGVEEYVRVFGKKPR